MKIKKQKKFVKKRKFKFRYHKNRLEAGQIENKIDYLEKNKIVVDSLKEFIKKNKLIQKTEQRFRREKHNVFTEQINEITLSSNYDNRIQSIDWIETYAQGMSKDLVCKEGEIKSNSIIKQYKNI